tara:strand:- start:3 stop:791 length:789 start_codon:yes stop_codon:yes gene_type:complete
MARVNATGKEATSNFSPANGTGLAVRTAIKDVLESLRTINSASGDPTGTANLAAYQLHIDSDNDNLRIRNSANSAFITLGNVGQTNLGLLPLVGGTLTGVLGLSNASASAPSVHFGDSTTGFFRKGANQIGLSFAGTERAFFDQNGLTLQTQTDLRFADSDSSHYIGLQAPATISSNFTLTLPATDSPVSGYALISNAAGVLSWGVAGGAAGNGDQIFWENDQTVTGNYTITNGKNAGSFGPIAIANGVTVTVGSGETWTVV